MLPSETDPVHRESAATCAEDHFRPSEKLRWHRHCNMLCELLHPRPTLPYRWEASSWLNVLLWMARHGPWALFSSSNLELSPLGDRGRALRREPVSWTMPLYTRIRYPTQRYFASCAAQPFQSCRSVQTLVQASASSTPFPTPVVDRNTCPASPRAKCNVLCEPYLTCPTLAMGVFSLRAALCSSILPVHRMPTTTAHVKTWVLCMSLHSSMYINLACMHFNVQT